MNYVALCHFFSALIFKYCSYPTANCWIISLLEKLGILKLIENEARSLHDIMGSIHNIEASISALFKLLLTLTLATCPRKS